MSKPIKSYSDSEKKAVIARRINSKSGGLGYISAVEAEKKIAAKVKADTLAQAIEKKEQEAANG